MKTRYENDQGGHRVATSVSGLGTGEGADRLIADDVHKVREAESPTMREAVSIWWDETMSTRGNNPKTVAKVIIMQRIHAEDLTGHLLEQGGYHHLCLPAEYEPRIHEVHSPLPSPSAPVIEQPRAELAIARLAESLPRISEMPKSKNLKISPKPNRVSSPISTLSDSEKTGLRNLFNPELTQLDTKDRQTRMTDPEPHDDCCIYSDPRTIQGELLCPERFGEAELKTLKRALGTAFSISGQLQQRPVPREGALFKAEHFRPLPEDLDISQLQIIQMWDLAYSARQSADFTACLTAGIDRDSNIYLLHAWKTRVEELKDFRLDDLRGLGGALTTHIARLNPTPGLVGIWSGAFDKRLATQVLAARVMRNLHARGVSVRIVSIPETTDKVMRAQLPAGKAEMGEIFADTRAPWWPEFLAQLLEFPRGAHDDYVDTISGIAHLATLLRGLQRREGHQQLTMGAQAERKLLAARSSAASPLDKLRAKPRRRR